MSSWPVLGANANCITPGPPFAEHKWFPLYTLKSVKWGLLKYFLRSARRTSHSLRAALGRLNLHKVLWIMALKLS